MLVVYLISTSGSYPIIQQNLGETVDERKGPYQHEVIQKVINIMWFNKRADEGILYSEFFDPMPVPAIALVLTAVSCSATLYDFLMKLHTQIECSIDEWLTGSKASVTFSASDYKAIYMAHIRSLMDYGQETSRRDLLGKLQTRLYNYGRYVHLNFLMTTID